jgi:hypothetical protein
MGERLGDDQRPVRLAAKDAGLQTPIQAQAAADLAMLLRPGNAGANTFTDHMEVLAAAIRQSPPGSGPRSWSASTGPGRAMIWPSTCCRCPPRRRKVLFTCAG